jgi:hypothetical protein
MTKGNGNCVYCGNFAMASRRTRDRAQWLSMAVLMVIGIASEASASTIYEANIDSILTLNTAVQTNIFGFAIFPPITKGDAQQFFPPNAQSQIAVGAVTTPSNPMHHVVDATGSTAGVLNDPEFAFSWGETFQMINIANLTGSGPPTPPGRTLDINFTFDSTWTASAMVGDPTGEVAGALIHYEVLFNGGVLLGNQGFLFRTEQVQAPPNGAAVGHFNDTFDVHLAANSVATLVLHTWAEGYGVSNRLAPPVAPPMPIPLDPPPFFTPVPESSSLVLFATGFGVMMILRRARKQFGP